MNDFKHLQFVIILINANAEVKGCVSADNSLEKELYGYKKSIY